MATISANGDQSVGNLISKAMEIVGREGVITVKVCFNKLRIWSQEWLGNLNYYSFVSILKEFENISNLKGKRSKINSIKFIYNKE